jgi:hypothetical protein
MSSTNLLNAVATLVHPAATLCSSTALRSMLLLQLLV